MASCAACLKTILRSHQFVLDGTEVFHRSCVGQAYRSMLRIAEQRGRELESQLADTRRAASRVEAEVNRLRNEGVSLAVAITQLSATQDRLRATQDELRASCAENIALRAELATVKQDTPVGRDDSGCLN